MNSINSEILGLAKSISEKLEQPSDSELEFEITSPRKNKTKVENVFKTPKLPLSLSAVSETKSNIFNASLDIPLERMNTAREEVSKSDKTQNNSADNNTPLPLPPQFSAMKQTEICSTNFMSLEDISEDEELWLIMAPKDCKLKKQNVEMEGRQELKGGKFEIEFFKSDSENNMTTLVCDNEELVSGPHFKGCVQISEKLQTFSPKYRDIVKKGNLIPSELKPRYVPFGADIDGVRFKKDRDTKGLRMNTSTVGFDIGIKSKVHESQGTDVRLIPEIPITKDTNEKSRLKRKHSVIESKDIPASEVNSLMDSQDTEITDNSEISKKKKKKKRKSHHEDSNE